MDQKGKGEYDIVIPMSIHGQNYFVLNDGKKEVNDDTVVAGPATIYVRILPFLSLISYF